ncbi:hypothetical protein OUZ56_018924 [Daphnia magna]|uniref:Uncharacterized protein n=1 Tax=Daphnia magna TaxID=35525 RepID=A0ABQ9ZA69_9CRUS|nr:hypothetical protein OUZ56_018924 [Daphnia magna]
MQVNEERKKKTLGKDDENSPQKKMRFFQMSRIITSVVTALMVQSHGLIDLQGRVLKASEPTKLTAFPAIGDPDRGHQIP